MGGKSKGQVITPEETMALIEQQQVMNNPNVSNMFGDTQTTFGADGQAQITQNPSDVMRGLIEQQQGFVGGGSAQLDLQRDPQSQGMADQFMQRVGQRSGFEAPPSMGGQGQPSISGAPMGNDQMANLGQAPPAQGSQAELLRNPRSQAPPQMQGQMPMRDNAPNNGVEIGDGSQKFNFRDKMKKFGQGMNGESDNSLANALSNIYRREQ